MSGIEWRTLSQAIRLKTFRAFQKLNCNKDHYQDDGEARQVYEFVRYHWNHPDTARQFPSLQLLKRRFPGLQLSPEEDTPLESLIKELKYSVLSKDLQSLGATVMELANDEDPEEALRIAKSLILQANYQFEGGGAVNVAQVAEMALQEYEDAKSGISWGIPWPWEALTYDTKGKCPSNLIYIYARQKQMKSWISGKSASDDYEVHRRRVLWWSREMHIKDLAMRFGSLWSKVDYQLVEHGNLPPHKEIIYKQVLKEIMQHHLRAPEEVRELRDAGYPDILFLVGRDAPTTMEGLRPVIDEFEPDSIYLDSVHHMLPTKGGRQDSEIQGNLAREVKQLAIDTERPVIASGHANRVGQNKVAGTNTEDISRTDAWGGEGDLLLRVLKKKLGDLWEEDYEGYWEQQEAMLERLKGNQAQKLKMGRFKHPAMENIHKQLRPPKARTSAELALLVSGGRKGTLDGILINAIPGYRFDQLRAEITPAEAQKWLKEDEAAAEEEERKTKRSGNERPGAPDKARQTISYRRQPASMKEHLKGK